MDDSWMGVTGHEQLESVSARVGSREEIRCLHSLAKKSPDDGKLRQLTLHPSEDKS